MYFFGAGMREGRGRGGSVFRSGSASLSLILPVTLLAALFVFLTCLSGASAESPEDRRLNRGDSCSKIQHEIQKSIIHHKWGLDNLKFQQRLKRHPKYIVTIQQVHSVHEPIVELRCPPSLTQSSSSSPSTSLLSPSYGSSGSGSGGSGSGGAGGGGAIEPFDSRGSKSNSNINHNQKLEFHFHETRFTADSVRLFDIHSIFPIHTGTMSVKLKLDPLIVTMDKMRETHPSINEVYYSAPLGGPDFAKEHREDSDSVLDLEKEIESVFTNRIQPDIQKQLSVLISNTLKKYFLQNLVRF